MTKELARTGVAALGESGIAASLIGLLALTSDAVLVFGEDGRILLANEEAERLFRETTGGLVESDVRLLFTPAATLVACEGPLDESLPFPLDGSTTQLICQGHDQVLIPVSIRCERLHMPTTVYLLVAHAQAQGEDDKGEHERLVAELSRANRRLSGTLHIVFETLDSLDVGTLFSRVLDEIADTMDAWATLAYVAESDGYRLRGATSSVVDVKLPLFLPNGHPVVQWASRSGSPIRIHVTRLSRDDLRRGQALTREIVNEELGTSAEAATDDLPPFPSYVAVPVWFGGHMIALFEVGWRHAHRLRDDDLRLLDAVSEYLSVQLAGAFATLRAQHAEQLSALGSSLRERLMANDEIAEEAIRSVLASAAQGVGAEFAYMAGNVHQRTTIGDFDQQGVLVIPFDLVGFLREQGEATVTDLEALPEVRDWLYGQELPSRGLLLAIGEIEGVVHGALLLKDTLSEPFEEADASFLQELAEDILEAKAGERARTHDKIIAQALQRGMRNELQEVDGMSTQSCYMSATADAYVGGDFYDLIRLPDRRACVVMGDVSGKGVEAASVSAAVKTALGAYAWEGLRPARMVGLLNDFLLGFSRIETFATLFVGMVDLTRGRLAYCSAGHPPALLVRASSGELVSLGVQSGVVGAFENMSYRDGEVEVREGDLLLLYTDGVTEARSHDGAFFGEDGLREVVAREAKAGFEGLCDRIIDAVRTFGGGELNDDVALVVLRFDMLSSASSDM